MKAKTPEQIEAKWKSIKNLISTKYQECLKTNQCKEMR